MVKVDVTGLVPVIVTGVVEKLHVDPVVGSPFEHASAMLLLNEGNGETVNW